jgi:hypothetical protein
MSGNALLGMGLAKAAREKSAHFFGRRAENVLHTPDCPNGSIVK